MKLKAMFITVMLAGSFFICSTNGAEELSPPSERFRAGEFSFDGFGTVSIGQETINHLTSRRVRHDGRLGAGLGVNYFATRQFGFGLDAYSENTGHSVVDSASANFLYRFPFEQIGLAPYVFGGGGRQFDPTELWFAQAGGGLEFRFHRHWGIFGDARYVFTDGARNYGLGRFGVRAAF